MNDTGLNQKWACLNTCKIPMDVVHKLLPNKVDLLQSPASESRSRSSRSLQQTPSLRVKESRDGIRISKDIDKRVKLLIKVSHRCQSAFRMLNFQRFEVGEGWCKKNHKTNQSYNNSVFEWFIKIMKRLDFICFTLLGRNDKLFKFFILFRVFFVITRIVSICLPKRMIIINIFYISTQKNNILYIYIYILIIR